MDKSTGGAAMKSVAVKQTKDQIADLIRADILSGTLRGGDELTQEQVAEQTGLSRMPVREAFQALEQEGFLVRLPNRHMRVVEITQSNLQQYFAAVIALECSFFEQLSTDDALKTVEHALTKAIQDNSPAAEYEVHAALAAALGNEYLLGIHKKMLGSFYQHSLHRGWQPAAAEKPLRGVLVGLQKADQKIIAKSLTDYFAIYEKVLTKGKKI